MPFATRRKIRIHYELEGNGPDVVLLPGLGGSIAPGRRVGYARALPDHRRLSVEPRGHGESGRPRDPTLHRIEEYRDDIVAAMDDAGIDRAILWGFSDGGTLAFAVAEAYPRRVRAVIDHDGYDGADLTEPVIRDDRLARARAYASFVGEDGARRFRERASAVFSLPPDHPWVAEYLKNDPQMLAFELAEWTRWAGPKSVLPHLEMPILLIARAGAEPERVERIRNHVPTGVVLELVPAASHLELVLDLDRTAPRVRRFVATLPD